MNGLICGLAYGDEGKGRVSAYFLEKDNYEWSVRFNGGPNAGHTVYRNGKKFALHHFPAGATIPGKKIALDAGMVIDVHRLYDEYQLLPHQPTVYISENAHVITEDHKESDIDGSGIGSTKRGIAYAYGDKALRQGRRIKDEFADKTSLLHLMNVQTYKGLPPCIENQESALYESAQAVMLDIDYGAYPYVTSSSVFPTIVHNIGRRVGVLKAYNTRVGSGPPNYPEIPKLADIGNEYGTTTGRKRRCTWLAIDELQYALSILQPDEIVLTKVDILEQLGEIGVWMSPNELMTFKSRREFEQFLMYAFPKILWVSDTPDGDLKKVYNGQYV